MQYFSQKLLIILIHSIGLFFLLFTATNSPFKKDNMMFSFSFLESFEGYASEGKLFLEVKVSSPPTLVPQRPLLIEYLALVHSRLIPFSFK